jgi:phosphatidylinositol 4-kinase
MARKCFIESFAGYAVASYILQIKDRHNGNILIDNEGHLIHIDFGFIFNISPAGNLKFERPEFKMTKEMIEIMGNETSESFTYFKDLVVRGFIMVRDYAQEFISIVELTKHSGFTCFRKNTMRDLKNRFYLKKRLPKVARKV